MNDIFTRGRHEESIICTERMLISQPLEEKAEREKQERSAKQREKVKDVRAKKDKKKGRERIL